MCAIGYNAQCCKINVKSNLMELETDLNVLLQLYEYQTYAKVPVKSKLKFFWVLVSIC